MVSIGVFMVFATALSSLIVPCQLSSPSTARARSHSRSRSLDSGNSNYINDTWETKYRQLVLENERLKSELRQLEEEFENVDEQIEHLVAQFASFKSFHSGEVQRLQERVRARDRTIQSLNNLIYEIRFGETK